jgi:hypothetical protein
MKRRGVCYDAGRVMWGQNWRPDFSAAAARRELAIIRDDLHCDAVRICGEDLDRLTMAGEQALEDPVHDLDMASYALVRSLAGRLGNTYPDMPWEPKKSFRSVAGWYGAREPSPT